MTRSHLAAAALFIAVPIAALANSAYVFLVPLIGSECSGLFIGAIASLLALIAGSVTFAGGKREPLWEDEWVELHVKRDVAQLEHPYALEMLRESR